MGQIRTDLAAEAHQLWREQGHPGALEGVREEEGEVYGYPAHRVSIDTPQGAEALGKPQGTYLTLVLEGLLRREAEGFSRGAQAIAHLLSPLLPSQGLALVVGLGNRAITPDLIGPLTVDHTLITRHLVEHLPQFGAFRPVAALSPGVLATTGVESGDLVKAAVEQLHPTCVIAVDALAARSVERLCRTVQISDSGIVPGSGVGNHRLPLDRATLGVPVATVGVPTVVDGATLAADLLGKTAPHPLPGGDLFVTPREVDSRVADLSKVIGYGISLALNPALTVEDLTMLLE